MLSLLFYNAVLALSVFFAWLANLKQGRVTAFLFLFISFSVIFLFSCLRFDVGPDYYGYVNIFQDLRYRDQAPRFVENSFFWLVKIFEDYDSGYVYILGIYSFISLLILYFYSGLRRLPYVLFFFMTMSVGYFTFDDQVRQFLAISIWLLGVRFIVEKNIIGYISFCLFASLFHFSALLMLPFYFLARITLPLGYMLVFFILMVFVFYFELGIFAFKKIFEFVPHYNKYAFQEDYLIGGTASSTGIGVLLNMIVFMYAIVYRRLAGHLYLTNLLFFGIVIMLISSGNLVITRFSKYFLVLGIFLVAEVLYNQKNILRNSVIVLLLIVFFERAILNREVMALSYQTIFSDNFDAQILRRDLQ